jgi:hypothetical protein
MSGPHESDDGWAELARELGLEEPRPTPKPPVAAPPSEAKTFADFENPAPSRNLDSTGWDDPTTDEFASGMDDDEQANEADGDGEDESEEGAEAEEGIEAGGDGSGEPGETKKKRRRRRRRRKKGPGEADAANSPEASEPGESDSYEEQDEQMSDSLEPVGEEAPSPEASRELIANWDVPSWETIIQTMLHRPSGR